MVMGLQHVQSLPAKIEGAFEDMPIMVTEYGVPSSIGVSHHGPGGKDQGGMMKLSKA